MPTLPIRLTLLLLTILVFRAEARAQDGPSPGERLPVREVELDNGMRVLVLPRPGAPTVATVVRFRVGGVNEVRGRTGIAHLLEHLLFKGTSVLGTTNVDAERALFARMDSLHDSISALRGRGGDSARIAEMEGRIRALEDSARVFVVPNEFDRILSTAGARGLNATTGSEATTYFVELPAPRLELWFAMEADRMRDPVFREFYSERDVVMEERRLRIDTRAGGLLYENHLRAAFTEHPYGQPVVGTSSDLRSLRRADVKDYYRRFYGPNNAVVAIVGDVDPDQVEAWAGEYFGALPRGEVPTPVLSVEPEQRGERRIEVLFDAEPAVRIGWHVSAVPDDDMPALVMLTSLLTGGRTSRLYRRLVLDDRIATGVTAGIGPGSRDPQLFTLEAAPLAPHTTRDIEAAIYEELDRLANTPPDPREIRRVRNRLEAGQFRRLSTNLGLAFQLVDSEALFDDWRATFRFSARIARVTAEDVQAVVRRYFRPENRTVATLVTDRPGPGGGR